MKNKSLELENITPYEVISLATEILKREALGKPGESFGWQEAINQALDLLELAAEALEARRNDTSHYKTVE